VVEIRRIKVQVQLDEKVDWTPPTQSATAGSIENGETLSKKYLKVQVAWLKW
jgi:hypothetical protein